MPNKTIYISEDNLPLFERAQQLEDNNLSSAIARAVRRFVEVQRALADGYEEVTVPVGKSGGRQKKRFLAVRLARWRVKSSSQKRMDIVDVYQTAKGQFAVHTRKAENWALWSDPETWRDPANWGLEGDWQDRGEARLEVFESLERLRENVPDDLYRLVLEASAASPLEDLDI